MAIEYFHKMAIHVNIAVHYCDTEHRAKSFFNHLSADEISNSKIIKNLSQKIQYIVGKCLARMLLSRRVGVDPKAIKLKSSSYGKPYLSEPCGFKSLNFNITHTEGLVGCAISDHFEVGLDAENTSFDKFTDDVLPLCFTLNEISLIENLPEAQRKFAKFKIWTAKEAFLKCVGLGLSVDPVVLDVGYSENETWQICLPPVAFGGGGYIWKFWKFQTHIVCLCVSSFNHETIEAAIGEVQVDLVRTDVFPLCNDLLKSCESPLIS